MICYFIQFLWIYVQVKIQIFSHDLWKQFSFTKHVACSSKSDQNTPTIQNKLE